MLLDYLILALLVSPVPLPVPSQVPDPVFAALQRQALALDLVGPRENWRSDFAAELAWCWNHLRLLADAPPSADAALLSPHGDAVQAVVCLRAHLEYLCLRRQVLLHLAEELAEQAAETRQLLAIWEAIAVATDETAQVCSRRAALRRLQHLLPEGELPPWGPIWRFHDSTR